MRLTILGSGTTIPSRDRSSPSLALWIQGEPVLLDLGPGTLRQMARAGIRHEALRHIFLTHFHPDHTGDLVHFLFATRNPHVIRNRATVVIAGAAGLNDFIRRLQDAWGDWLKVSPEIMKVREFDLTEKFESEYRNFTVVTSPVDHTPHSLAYRLTDRKGRCVVFSGDTGYCDALVDLSVGADLLVLEASFPEGLAVQGHLTPAEAGKVATEAGVDRLVLTHFYPEVLDTDIEEQCRRSYGGELILARDLMHIQV